MKSFIASNESPMLIPSKTDFWAILENIKIDPTPNWVKWVWEVARKIGFSVVEPIPVHWNGRGCFILERVEKAIKFKDFEFLAFLNLHYDSMIIVGIPDAAAYLQFHRLIQPLMKFGLRERIKKSDSGWSDGRMVDSSDGRMVDSSDGRMI